MYLEYFGFQEHPFRLTPDSNFLYLSEGHARAKAYMEYTIWNQDSFVVITGEIGSGKTTLIQKILSELDKDVIVAKIHQTQLSETEFLQALLAQFGFEPFSAGKVEVMNKLNRFLAEKHTEGKRVVLIVDEAQNLGTRVLEEIRLLSGLETEKKTNLNVSLVGQPELKDALDVPGMAQLAQRIRLRFHLSALSQLEMKDYIEHRQKVAGRDGPSLFSDDTMPLIYTYTNGIPRLINILCDTILTVAFVDDLKTISPDAIKTALDELQWKPFATRFKNAKSTSEDDELFKLEDVRKLILSQEGQVLGEYPLKTESMTIGRNLDNDISIDDRTVSGYHARITNKNNKLTLHDLRSTNGTYVNAKAVKRCVLEHGDIITITRYQLTLVAGSETLTSDLVSHGDTGRHKAIDDTVSLPALNDVLDEAHLSASVEKD